LVVGFCWTSYKVGVAGGSVLVALGYVLAFWVLLVGYAF
jgi:predicted acyltransferase